MKRRYIYFVFTCLALIVNSCIKDNSQGADNPISKIELSGNGLQDEYIIDRWGTLEITSPEFSQTNSEKPLSYQWEIYDKEPKGKKENEDKNFFVVSREKNLSYICSKYGKHKARLKVTNGDSFYFKEFDINVRYSYARGLYLLASLDGKTILSYEPDIQENEDNKGKVFEQDILEKNNNQSFGTAKVLYFTNTENNPLLYIASENPLELYQLSANLMVITKKLETPGVIQSIQTDGVGNTAFQLYTMIDNRLADTNSHLRYFQNSTQQGFENIFGEVKLFKDFLHTYNNGYKEGTVFFDNKNSKMILSFKGWGVTTKELFKDEFSDFKMKAMEYIGTNDIIGIFKNESTHQYRIYWFNPSKANPEMKGNNDVPNTAEMKDNSIFITAKNKNLLYYSSDNKIFAYNVLSLGNFATSPLFICGTSSEMIVDMYVDKNQKKLYVATNNSSQTLQGSIYCYDIEKKQLLWEKKNITGEIFKIDYRYQ